MRKPWDTVKIKILLGYLFLAGMGAFMGWLIYSEILLFSENKSRISKLNNKILYFNSILTNLYQAEALERTYSQTGNPAQYGNYENLMDAIYQQFDTLSAFLDSPQEKMHTDSILMLLKKKRENLKQLSALKNISTDDLYNQAIDQFSFNRDTLSSMINVKKTITDKSESTYVEQKRRKFFERLAYAFSPNENKDSVLQISKQQTVRTDTIINEINTADSVIQFLTAVMEDIRNENRLAEQQLARKEREVLASDRTITIQLRRILSLFEKDILVNSLDEMQMLQERVKNATWYLISLGVMSFFIIIIFLVMILKDITRSQRYRIQLEESKAYSDSLLKSKEQFMLNITHDIKSPIASVSGYARLMMETSDVLKKKFYLNNINKSVDHILSLISDLFDLTRLESGKLKIEQSKFQINSLVDDICSGFYPLADEKNLNFVVINRLPEPMWYQNDPNRIKQILGNILSNAIKYTDQGSVTLTFSAGVLNNKTDQLRFDIADTGIGISDEDNQLIFNEFTQVHLKDRERYEGVGLGLNIAKRLTDLLGGSISLNSKPGEGSCFTVLLPMERSTPEVLQIPGDQRIIAFSGISVILIDDDEPLLHLYTETLQQTGITVYKCNSASQAIHIAHDHTVDLIITDMHMPTMNANEMLSFMQKRSGRHIPVIIVSGQESIIPDDFPGIAIAAFLKKPFSNDDLFETIIRVLHRKVISMEKPVIISPEKVPEQKPYTLEQIKQFAMNDQDSIHSILISFVESSYQNLSLFEKFMLQKNHIALSELSHKMLAMFRQLSVQQIVSQLVELEMNKDGRMHDEDWLRLATDTRNKIEDFLELFCNEQAIFVRT